MQEISSNIIKNENKVTIGNKIFNNTMYNNHKSHYIHLKMYDKIKNVQINIYKCLTNVDIRWYNVYNRQLQLSPVMTKSKGPWNFIRYKRN